MASQIVIFFALFVLSFAAFGVLGHNKEDNGPAHYKFEYAVHDPHTGDKKQQYEVRDGHTVKGAYSLADADGTIRIVEYVADPHGGFNAVVKRVGHAHHPQHYNHHHGGASSGHGGDTGGAHGAGRHGQAHSYVGVTHFGYQH